jgi:hypothetical protein
MVCQGCAVDRPLRRATAMTEIPLIVRQINKSSTSNELKRKKRLAPTVFKSLN